MSFSKNIEPFVTLELESARIALSQGDSKSAFTHLENAHVLGQASTKWHTITHYRMLVWAISERDARELIGQVLRLLGAIVITPFGLIPLGNTGGSNVSPFKPMPIQEEHLRVIDEASST